MERRNQWCVLGIFSIMILILSCGLDNHRSEKEKREDIREGGNNVEYKDARESGSPSLSDTAKRTESMDSVRYKSEMKNENQQK